MVNVVIVLSSLFRHKEKDWIVSFGIEKTMPTKPSATDEICIFKDFVVVRTVVHHLQEESIEVICERLDRHQFCYLFSSISSHLGWKIVLRDALGIEKIKEAFLDTLK